jgi:hypothetical protein
VAAPGQPPRVVSVSGRGPGGGRCHPRHGAAREAGWSARCWWWSAPDGHTTGCAGLRGPRRHGGWVASRRRAAARSARPSAHRSNRT